MTDNDIMKALECCTSSTTSEACNGCPLYSTTICTEMENGLMIYALDLINRQKAEIERLRKYNTDVAFKHYNDGIKEFAERLKDRVDDPRQIKGAVIDLIIDDIDKLVKEMTEEKWENK